MSKAAVKWAKAQDLPFTEKAVLVEIAVAHSPRWGTSEPSQHRIASNLGITRETVNRVIKRLESRGLIAKVALPRKKGQWDRRAYLLNPSRESVDRVTEDHTAPCDSHQTRHRVTEDHTSKRDNSTVLTFPFQGSAARRFA